MPASTRGVSPVIPPSRGWYADPEAVVYGREHGIYPTWSDDYPVAHLPGTKSGNHRDVGIDAMPFDPDGTIRPVQITFEGVMAQRVLEGR